ncbi:hypothetical protein G5I_07984 [Acromyrmex echinatior]|uniref:Uncharacterized protein n=1 Tax=Acromyrmex echinatior TaxID=103372 RepID=F4WQA0_ACREC|nr:hypothetical protein G5I_07984 [Acromyrmex echinatior]
MQDTNICKDSKIQRWGNAGINPNIRFLTSEPRKRAQTGSERLPSAVERVGTVRARWVPGGLNLLLAFNGVCKLYSKKRARHERLCARDKDYEEHERIEWSAEGDEGGNEKL